jgi:hypothetical protein
VVAQSEALLFERGGTGEVAHDAMASASAAMPAVDVPGKEGWGWLASAELPPKGRN